MSSSKPKEAPKDIQPDALIHPTAILTGDHLITVASKAIIQPRTTLDSSAHQIKVGADTIISERSTIGSKAVDTDHNLTAINIGQGVILETGTTISAGATIGDFTIIAAGATVGPGATIGTNCSIAQRVTILERDTVPDNMVVWGDGWDQRRIGIHDGGREGLVKGLANGLRAVWSNK